MEWQGTRSAVLPVRLSAALHNPVWLPRCSCYGSSKGHGAGATSRRASHVFRRPLRRTIQASTSNGTEEAVRDVNANNAPREGASTDLSIIWARLVKVSLQLPSKSECSMRLQMRSSRYASAAWCAILARSSGGEEGSMGAGWGCGPYTGADRCKVVSSECLPHPVHTSDPFAYTS